jgi:2,4-dienoyl-CoA reductase-like NADH-dependent reductase (Old Yellow Enzyme family)/thioredoxin reductase
MECRYTVKEQQKEYEKLFEPIKLGQLTIKNRIEASPVFGRLVPPDGHASRELIEYFKAKARGGAGIVTIGESATDGKYGASNSGQFVLDRDDLIPSLSRLADAIKRYGAKASLEVSHGGCYADPRFISAKAPIGPSAMVARFLGGPPTQVQEMTKAHMDEVVESFAQAALRLKRAGFDMMLLHGGHGWLLSQFVSPLTNRRTDEYGGSLENRARFPLRVIDGIREMVGPEFAIEYRISGEDCAPGGMTIDDTVAYAKLIEHKVDSFHVSMGTFSAPAAIHRHIPPAYMARGCNVYAAAKIKAVVSIPVTTVGAIMDPEMAVQILEEGKADIIASARGFLADPEWPNKVRTGRRKDVTPCIRCLECVSGEVDLHPVSCAVNPTLARETELALIAPPKEKRKVVIVGGGPAGMQAAITAVSRGHEVTLLEKEGRLGGNLSFAVIPAFKDDAKRFLAYLVQKVEGLPIKTMLSTEANREMLKKMAPDVVIVAVGADPIVPITTGVQDAVFATDALAGSVKVGDTVVVVGGGMIGCELALFLAQQGKKVTVLEMLDGAAADLNILSKAALFEELAAHKVEVLTGEKVLEISAKGAVSVNKDGRRLETTGETVVLAAGYTARRALVEALNGSAEEMYVVGDCAGARKVYQAVHEGFAATAEL